MDACGKAWHSVSQINNRYVRRKGRKDEESMKKDVLINEASRPES